jgi:hypothetical protein
MVGTAPTRDKNGVRSTAHLVPAGAAVPRNRPSMVTDAARNACGLRRDGGGPRPPVAASAPVCAPYLAHANPHAIRCISQHTISWRGGCHSGTPSS